ncbi:gephyrin-like molybdotransferase Glp [Thermicanus aegyptius]|uniref:molybdopterin molybdotransferase MoeA n=1 Tax=Thermicanus aegyptius TaxID=94009 RepID=UPI000421BD1A|nr:gephyrin-like molybdotransferase Glp [Thermicanus aegyptius]
MLRERKPIPVEEALVRILRNVKTLGTEEIPLDDAYGRILAESLVADHTVPPFDKSGVDGYAVIAEETKGASHHNPILLEVIETVGAGSVPRHRLSSGQAIRIMTGAPIPKGANAVVMFEKTERVTENGKEMIRVLQEMKPGEDISYRGEDVKEGEVLLQPGKRMGPGEIALLATYGYGNCQVFKKPVVGILATGSELLPVSSLLEPGKIRDSNGAMLTAQVMRVGAVPKHFGIVADRLEEMKERVREILPQVDLLLTTGGVSVGDYDFMYDLYQALGAEVLFDKLLMRPGKPTTVAVLDGKLLYGLSGNPGAAYVGFELFVRPALLMMMGVPESEAHLPRARGILDEDIKKPSAFPKYVRAIYSYHGKELHVSLAGPDRSSLTSTLQRANCLALIPAGGKGVEKGSEIDIFFLDRCEHP